MTLAVGLVQPQAGGRYRLAAVAARLQLSRRRVGVQRLLRLDRTAVARGEDGDGSLGLGRRAVGLDDKVPVVGTVPGCHGDDAAAHRVAFGAGKSVVG